MKLIIARPQDWIDTSKKRTAKIWFYDVEALYDNIEVACKELGIEFVVKHLTPHTRIDYGRNIYLGHHTYGSDKNMWHIKKGYVPGYMYWDKTGYSGWSEAVSRYDPKAIYLEETLLKTRDFIEKYIKNNESKIKQPTKAKIPKDRYILVLGQRPHDTVSKHAYIDTIKLSTLVNEAYKEMGTSVYTKPHPMSLTTPFFGKIIQGSMHHLIAGASVIYTVNSGSGFESLFHMKPVVTTGTCDYSPATFEAKNLQDIKDSRALLLGNPILHTSKILHFLTYCFEEHFVNCYDLKSIKRKLLRCINEYEV